MCVFKSRECKVEEDNIGLFNFLQGRYLVFALPGLPCGGPLVLNLRPCARPCCRPQLARRAVNRADRVDVQMGNVDELTANKDITQLVAIVQSSFDKSKVTQIEFFRIVVYSFPSRFTVYRKSEGLRCKDCR